LAPRCAGPWRTLRAPERFGLVRPHEAAPNRLTGSGPVRLCLGRLDGDNALSRPRNISVPRAVRSKAAGSTARAGRPRRRRAESRPPRRLIGVTNPAHRPSSSSARRAGLQVVARIVDTSAYGSRREGQSKGNGVGDNDARARNRGPASRDDSRIRVRPGEPQFGGQLLTPGLVR
jgi:hypothetical protein